MQYLSWQPPKLHVDLIHSLFAFPYAICGYRLSNHLSRPLIVGAQGTFGVKPLTQFPEKWLLKTIYNHSQIIHTPSQFTKDHIQKFSNTNTQIKIIPNGIDLKKLQPCSIKPKTFDQSKKINIIGIGALKPRKGFKIAIKAISQIIHKHPNIYYSIAGEGKSREALQSLIHQLKLQNHVRLLGHTPRNNLKTLFQQADLYLHTPTNNNWHFEGFGIVYVEAAAFGLPVIASRSGGVPSAVLHGKTGLLAKESSVKSTSRAIIKILSSPSLYNQMSQNSLTWAKKHDWKLIVRQFENIYHSAVNATSSFLDS